jgi:hypothetical protein
MINGQTHLNIPRERDGLVVGSVFGTGDARALGCGALAKAGNLAEKALLAGGRDRILTAGRTEDGLRRGLLGVELFGVALWMGSGLEDATGSWRGTAKRTGSGLVRPVLWVIWGKSGLVGEGDNGGIRGR